MKKNRAVKTKIMVLFIVISISLVLCSKGSDERSINKGKNKNNEEINNMKVNDLIKILNSGEIKNYTLVDVRTEEEYREGHVPGAILKPVQEITSPDDLVKFDKSKPIIVYCRSGSRSFLASSIFKRAGFDVNNLEGGILGLIESGYKGVVRN